MQPDNPFHFFSMGFTAACSAIPKFKTACSTRTADIFLPLILQISSFLPSKQKYPSLSVEVTPFESFQVTRSGNCNQMFVFDFESNPPAASVRP